jgi:hypothetical protein
LGSPRLTALPISGLAQAFGAIEAILTTDPALARAGITWRAWAGDYHEDGEVLDLLDPSPRELPMVRVKVAGFTSAWENVGQHKVRLALGFDLFVPGTHRDDILNLWSAVILALFPQDPARLEAVRAILRGIDAGAEFIRPQVVAGPITDVSIPAEARSGPTTAQADVIGESRYALKSTGLIEAIIYLNT